MTLASIRGEPDRAKRLINCLLALLVGVAIASTWYGPNLDPFFDYVARATYGEDAVLRTGAAEAFSIESARLLSEMARGMVDVFNLRTPHDDLKIAETIDALAALGLRSDAVIGTIGTAHAFYQANSLRLAAVRRGLAWNFEWWPPLDPRNPARAISEAPLLSAEAILIRWGGPTNVPLAAIVSSAPILFDPAVGQFNRVAELELGGGSHVIVLKRTDR